MLGDKQVCPSIAVKDLGEAKKFYQDVLGLEVSSEHGGGIFFKSGNGGVFVYTSEQAGTNKATYASWTVDDVEGTVAELSSKGVTFEHYDNIPGAELVGDVHVMGSLKSAWFTDPDGNILNIVSGM